MMRWLKRGIVALLFVVVALLAPVGVTEFICKAPRDLAGGYDPILPPEHHRPLTRTFMTYPEWHIVHAYDDYARVIEAGDPHEFGYVQAITGYWNTLCVMKTRSEAVGDVDGDTKLMVYTIGVSFAVEMGLKAAYEETLGRLFATLRGPDHAPLDDLSAEQARAYATFLQQVPWHQWDFRADAAALVAAKTGVQRDQERAIALGLEYRAKAAYAGVISSAVEALGPDELALRMIVTGAAPQALSAFDGVTVIGPRDEGIEIETIRYRALTGLMKRMAGQGVEFVEIAGNGQIMLTAIGQKPLDDAIYSFPRQGYGDTRSLVLLPVADLAGYLRENGAGVEHIHDY